MDKAVKQIIDATESKRPDYRRPGRPMPAAEDETQAGRAYDVALEA